MKKYKAIISDIDGTLTPLIPNALPSEKVTNAVKKAIDSGCTFCLGTGRPYYLMEYLIKHLHLTSPVITDNGAVVSDSRDGSILWEAILPTKEAQEIIGITKKYGFTRISTQTTSIDNPTNVPADTKVRKVSVHDISPQKADSLIKEIGDKYKDLAISKAASYDGDKYTDVYISNAHATKQHAVLKVTQILGISTKEIIGIGDGYNDFPLLMACGLKVAMGNAIDELKEIADYVAPSVHKDGLAHVIEKFIL